MCTSSENRQRLCFLEAQLQLRVPNRRHAPQPPPGHHSLPACIITGISLFTAHGQGYGYSQLGREIKSIPENVGKHSNFEHLIDPHAPQVFVFVPAPHPLALRSSRCLSLAISSLLSPLQVLKVLGYENGVFPSFLRAAALRNERWPAFLPSWIYI